MPRRPSRAGIAGLWAVALAALTMATSAREFSYGDVSIRQLPDLPQSTTHGYHEFPFLVVNTSQTETRRVTISGPSSSQVGMGLSSLKTISRTLTVGPGSSTHLALLQPSLPTFGSGLEVHIDGQLQPEVIPWTSGHPEYWVGGPGRHALTRLDHQSRRILISQQLDEDDFPPHSDEDYRVFRAVIPIASWSENWLAYSGFEGIVATGQELGQAPAGVIEALWRYVETGGTLLRLGPSEMGTVWQRSLDERPHATAQEQGLRVDYAGFGVALGTAVPGLVSELSLSQLGRVESAWLRSREPWDRLRDPLGAHRLFSVSEKVQVPVRGLFFVVLIFTLLIGPVNLALLTRWNKRMWLLWTVPLASLLASLAVMASVLVGEGLVRVQRTEGLTILNERTRRATTLGWTGFYATLTPGDGLRFDSETEVSPIVSWIYNSREDATRTLEWGDGQHLGLGWMKARLPSYFLLRKSESRRERVELRRREDGALEAVNGLGVDLKSLWVADREGRLYVAEATAAGAAVTLEPSPDTVSSSADVLRGFYQGDVLSRMRRLEQEPAGFMLPGSYLAVAAASPFLEPGLADADQTKLKAVIYGLSRDAQP